MVGSRSGRSRSGPRPRRTTRGGRAAPYAAGSRGPPCSPARSRRRPGRWSPARRTAPRWPGTGDHDLGQRPALDQRVVGRRGAPVVVDGQCGRGVALRVEVDHQHPKPVLGQGGGHVDRVVVLPTPPFWLATTITRVRSGRGSGPSGRSHLLRLLAARRSEPSRPPRPGRAAHRSRRPWPEPAGRARSLPVRRATPRRFHVKHRPPVSCFHVKHARWGPFHVKPLRATPAGRDSAPQLRPAGAEPAPPSSLVPQNVCA